ncbi:hypothetical protein ACVWYH_004338 [Bradyrhizobium sp. GM24.11]
METWQRVGTYAAGLALDFAGTKGNRPFINIYPAEAAIAGKRIENANVHGLLKMARPERWHQRTAFALKNQHKSA